MHSAAAPITASSLADAKLDNTQKRLSFLWDAAHAPGLAQMAPAVSASLIRSLRLVAFQEDIALAPSHTQTNFCSQCCALRVPGINTTARVEPSAARKKAERQKRRRKENRKEKRAANQPSTSGIDAPATDAATTTDPSDSDHSLVTPQKKRKRASLAQQTDSTSTAARAASASFISPFARRAAAPASATAGAQASSAASGFISPFAGRAALPVAASLGLALSSAASSSASSGVSSHCLVLHCLRCGHRDRIAGQTRKQKQMLQAAPNEIESLASQTEQGQSLIASEAAARDQQAKRQKTLQSLQVQQIQPSMLPQPKMRTVMPSLEELALNQQRMQQARANAAAGSFFGEQLRDVVEPTPRTAAAPSPSPSPSPAAPPASAAPFSFSRSGAPSGASAKKPSLSSLLAPAAAPASVFSSASMFASPGAGSMQGIRIASGMQSSAATASAAGAKGGYTFTKSSGAGAVHKKR